MEDAAPSEIPAPAPAFAVVVKGAAGRAVLAPGVADAVQPAALLGGPLHAWRLADATGDLAGAEEPRRPHNPVAFPFAVYAVVIVWRRRRPPVIAASGEGESEGEG